MFHSQRLTVFMVTMSCATGSAASGRSKAVHASKRSALSSWQGRSVYAFTRPDDVPGFADFLWADAIPKLLQARLIESFENYDIAHAPLRTANTGQARLPASDRCKAFPDCGGFRADG